MRGSFSVGAWRHAYYSLEDLSEITLAAKAHQLTDFCDGNFLVLQQVLRFGNPETRQIAAKRLTHVHLEISHKMGGAHCTGSRSILYRDGLSEVPVQKLKHRLQPLSPVLVHRLARMQVARVVLEQQ